MAFGGRNCTGALAPAYLSFLTASVSFVFFFITVAGNLLVCLAVYRDPNRELRTPFNFFVVNLAFADLIVGLVHQPISGVIHLKEGLTDRPLDDSAYILIHMPYFISCTASVLSLAALTIDRYIAIASPHYYRAKHNGKKTMIAQSLMIWVISISLPFIYFKVGYIAYAFVFVNTAVVLTLITLIVAYVQIYRKICNQFQISARMTAGMDKAQAKRIASENETQVTKAFMLVLVAYLLCYTPSCVMIYIMNFCLTCSCYSIHWLRDMQLVFVPLNSSLNPFLYAWRLPSFRSALGVIAGLRERKIRPSPGTDMTKSDSIHASQANIVAEEKPIRPPLPAAASEEEGSRLHSDERNPEAMEEDFTKLGEPEDNVDQSSLNTKI